MGAEYTGQPCTASSGHDWAYSDKARAHVCGRCGTWSVLRPDAERQRPYPGVERQSAGGILAEVAGGARTIDPATRPRRYLTDDRDLKPRHELVVSRGGNSDWYVQVLPEGHRMGPGVRICTSGGAAGSHPALPLAVWHLYQALEAPERDRVEIPPAIPEDAACVLCGAPAACFGRADPRTTPGFACEMCCEHASCTTRVHDLKTAPEPFAASWHEKKRHEVRSCRDRRFEVGDGLLLREVGDDGPTGRQLAVMVAHMTGPGQFGLPFDVCVMTFEVLACVLGNVGP